VEGNDAADEVAGAALDMLGELDDEPGLLWETDAVRARRATLRNEYDASIDEESYPTFKPEPSPRLPRRIARHDEKLLYRARIGVMPEIGGARYETLEPCPCCGQKDALGRHGRAVRHVLEQCPKHKMPDVFGLQEGDDVEYDDGDAPEPCHALWTHPMESIAHLHLFRTAATEAKEKQEADAGKAKKKKK
jgi:hypothetical protein